MSELAVQARAQADFRAKAACEIIEMHLACEAQAEGNGRLVVAHEPCAYSTPTPTQPLPLTLPLPLPLPLPLTLVCHTGLQP